MQGFAEGGIGLVATLQGYVWAKKGLDKDSGS
jgi:hypothetical protein